MGVYFDEPDPGPPAWCPGCDTISGSTFFCWTNDGRWLCPPCWTAAQPDELTLITDPYERFRVLEKRQLAALYAVPDVILAPTSGV